MEEEKEDEVELEPFNMRSEQERKDVAEKQVDETIDKMLSASKDWVSNGMTSLSLTELRKLKED